MRRSTSALKPADMTSLEGRIPEQARAGPTYALASRALHPWVTATDCGGSWCAARMWHGDRQRSYSVLIFSSLCRLAVMDSSTELVPLIHCPTLPPVTW